MREGVETAMKRDCNNLAWSVARRPLAGVVVVLVRVVDAVAPLRVDG